MSKVRKMIDAIACDDFDGARVALKTTLADYMTGKRYVSNEDIFGSDYKNDHRNPNIADELEMTAKLHGGTTGRTAVTEAKKKQYAVVDTSFNPIDDKRFDTERAAQKHLDGLGSDWQKYADSPDELLVDLLEANRDWSKVNKDSIEIDGVDTHDYPDFADAYISSAEWNDGTPLTDDELEAYTNDNGDVVNEKAHESLH